MSEELTATTIACLYLVNNEHCASCITSLACRIEELIRRHLNTTYALNRLDDNSCILARCKLLLQSLNIVQSHERHLAGAVYGSLNLWVIGNRHSHTCTTVKRSLHSQYSLSASSERRQLQSVLVCLGTAVAKEKLIIGIARQLAQLLRQLHLQ